MDAAAQAGANAQIKSAKEALMNLNELLKGTRQRLAGMSDQQRDLRGRAQSVKRDDLDSFGKTYFCVKYK
jgi:hypothetical protein